MRVRVLYFGVLKDAFGRAGSDVVLADGASVADLLKVVRGQEGFWDSIAVAVNQEYAKGSDVLKEGDEVALLPPVSGGVSEGLKFLFVVMCRGPRLTPWGGSGRFAPLRMTGNCNCNCKSKSNE